MGKSQHSAATRQSLIQAALKHFAHQGYAATSVQQIVTGASVSKPALYYYFADKAALFQALVDQAHDERYRRMTEAVAKGTDIRTRLVEIMASMFDFLVHNKELMRLAFATTLAAPGELPQGLKYKEKCDRNFQFIKNLMAEALERGELNQRYAAPELAFGFYGLMNTNMVSHLLMPEWPLNRGTAERVVELFLAGAAGTNAEKNPSK